MHEVAVAIYIQRESSVLIACVGEEMGGTVSAYVE